MPPVPFETLPEQARAWVFASDRALSAPAAQQLLEATDRFLDQWHAHGAELRSARVLLDDRFLVIGVDEGQAAASGCSIDGMFRVLRALEPSIGASLLGGGRVYYRAADGRIASASREEFGDRAAAGEVSGATHVFDTTVTTVGDLRTRFETEAARSWHAQLMPQPTR